MSEDIQVEPSAAPAAVIELIRSGSPTGDEFAVVPPASIGRFDPSIGPIDIDLGNLPEASYISRRHAKITFEDGEFVLHDNGSSNGTFVLRDDFERIESAPISDGAEIAFGNARFRFRLVAEPVEDEAELMDAESELEAEPLS